jgi:two-component system phosphate regulon sensor histidine kinase PhoR
VRIVTPAAENSIFQLLADAAVEALLVLDVNCRILAGNRAAFQLFEQPSLDEKTLLDFTRSPELDSLVRSALAYREEALEEQLIINKRHYRVRAQVLSFEMNPVIVVGLQDVSDLVRLNRARRDMVANISHELRTPVANIRSIIDSLFHEDEKPKRKRSISSLQAIARETDSLLWVIQEMLDLSMIETGQAIVRMVEVNLRSLVEEAADRMQDMASDKDIEIIYDVPKKLRVWCDWDMIRRVLVNLIHNAIKWSPKGSKIRIHAVNGGDEVIVQVTDEGPGVPDDQIERIFERFYQVDSSRSSSEGTGLGLAICKHIVEAHDGNIWAEPRSRAKGGVFLFTLMSADEPAEI